VYVLSNISITVNTIFIVIDVSFLDYRYNNTLDVIEIRIKKVSSMTIKLTPDGTYKIYNNIYNINMLLIPAS